MLEKQTNEGRERGRRIYVKDEGREWLYKKSSSFFFVMRHAVRQLQMQGLGLLPSINPSHPPMLQVSFLENYWAAMTGAKITARTRSATKK